MQPCESVFPEFRGGNRNQLIPAGGLFPDETDDSFLRLPAVAFDRDRRPEGKVYVPSGVQRAEVGKNFPPRQEIGFECERQEFDFGGAGQFDRDGVEPLRNEFGVAAAFRKDQDGAAAFEAPAPLRQYGPQILARIVPVDADGVHRPHRLAQKRNRKGVALDDVGEVEPGRDDRIQHKALHRAHMIPREHERAVSGGEVFKSAQVDFRSAALEDIDVLFAEPDLLPAAQQAVFRLSADPVEVLPDLQVKVQPAVQEKAGAQVAPVVRRIVAVF